MRRVQDWRAWRVFAGVGVSSLVSAAVAASFVLGAPSPAEARKKQSERTRAPAKQETALKRPNLPLLIIISIPKQRLTVYAGAEKITEAPVSTGQRGFDTPTGLFTILEKNRTHFSNLYDGAPMPFMQRITWSGVAMHAGVLPGYPASHGCIRLPFSFARELFGITSLGARVIITRDEVTPEDVAHGKLIAPLPSGELASDFPPPSAPAKEIEVASTETATNGAEAGLLAGVSQAAAAASGHAWPRPRTREEAAAIRAAKLAHHENAVKSAEAAVPESAARLESAVAAVRAAQEDVKPARAEFEKLSRLAKKAEGGLEAARERLADLTKRAEKRPTRSNTEALEKNKPLLEEKIKTFEAESAPSRAAADEAKRTLDRLLAVVASKEADRAQAAAAVKTSAATLRTAQQTLLAAKRAEAKRDQPITVFVSRKTQRLFVRQGHEPIAEAPVTIENAGQNLGTHVYTAIEPVDGGSALRWNVVSIPTRVVLKEEKETSSRKTDAAAPVEAPESTEAPPPQTASLALDRVTFPEETRDLLAELIKPGSSVVISDYGIGNETGKHTDFIILTRHPQDPAKVRKARRSPRVSSGDYYYQRRSQPRSQRRSRRSYSPPPAFFW